MNPDGALANVGTVKTGVGAKTGLFVPSLQTLFVAVPSVGSEPAQVRAFSTRP